MEIDERVGMCGEYPTWSIPFPSSKHTKRTPRLHIHLITINSAENRRTRSPPPRRARSSDKCRVHPTPGPGAHLSIAHAVLPHTRIPHRHTDPTLSHTRSLYTQIIG